MGEEVAMDINKLEKIVKESQNQVIKIDNTNFNDIFNSIDSKQYIETSYQNKTLADKA